VGCGEAGHLRGLLVVGLACDGDGVVPTPPSDLLLLLLKHRDIESLSVVSDTLWEVKTRLRLNPGEVLRVSAPKASERVCFPCVTASMGTAHLGVHVCVCICVRHARMFSLCDGLDGDGAPRCACVHVCICVSVCVLCVCCVLCIV
jgi:hypothetical protein